MLQKGLCCTNYLHVCTWMRTTGWYRRTENFEVYVTHNGDLDYMEELDSKVLRTHKELGLWLQLVLQTPRFEM